MATLCYTNSSILIGDLSGDMTVYPRVLFYSQLSCIGDRGNIFYVALCVFYSAVGIHLVWLHTIAN